MRVNFLGFNSIVLSMVGDVPIDSEAPVETSSIDSEAPAETLSISRICRPSLRRYVLCNSQKRSWMSDIHLLIPEYRRESLNS
jgi:hypothetical protein